MGISRQTPHIVLGKGLESNGGNMIIDKISGSKANAS